jgi:hypothetical protein
MEAQEVNEYAGMVMCLMAMHGPIRSARVWEADDQMAIVRRALDECYPSFAAMNN